LIIPGTTWRANRKLERTLESIIASYSAALVSARWDGFGLSQTFWGQVFIVAAIALAFFMLVAERDLAYGLVIVWALAGISASQGGHPEVASLAQAGAVGVSIAVLLLGILRVMKSRKV
jgi:hypothetical protein